MPRSDGMLVLIGEGFATYAVAPDGLSVRLGPGIIGAEVNPRLAPLGRKIGPDPASIGTCKIGGIATNNASGMPYRSIAWLLELCSRESIAVACAAVGLAGKESDLFRFTVKHSLFSATIVGVITMLQAYVFPWMLVP